MQTTRKSCERQRKICEMLATSGAVKLTELCTKFKCSEATIRNDLTLLEEKHLLKRIPGGAIPNESAGGNSILSKRMTLHMDEKKMIACYAVENLIKPNSIITLDSGTTNLILAQELLSKGIKCRVITNSFQAAMVLSKTDNIQLYLAGGTYDPDHGSFHDDVSEYIINTFSSEMCFLAPNGVDENGFVTNAGVNENSIKIQMMKHAKKTYLLIDSSKLLKTEIKVICKANDIEAIITDNNATNAQIKALQKAGFKIIIANNKKDN